MQSREELRIYDSDSISNKAETIEIYIIIALLCEYNLKMVSGT